MNDNVFEFDGDIEDEYLEDLEQVLPSKKKQKKMIEDDDIADDIYNAIVDQADKIIHDYYEKTIPGAEAWTDEHSHWIAEQSIEDLITKEEFLGLPKMDDISVTTGVYPSVIEDCVRIWEERKKRPITLVVCEEGFGSGKTFKESVLLWLQWVELCKYTNPQAYFNLRPDSWMAFMIFSRTEPLARRVAFTEVWNRFTCPFNRKYFPATPFLKREIQIKRNHTVVYAGSSSALSAIGYSLYGGCFSEDDKIKLSNGDVKSFGELENSGSLDIIGFDTNSAKFVDTQADNVIKTRENVDLYEVEMENGTKFKATPDQLFLTYRLKSHGYYEFIYKELKDITENDEIATDKDFIECKVCNKMKIKSKTYIGKHDVYDVINSKTQNFILENGVIAHNCLDESNFLEVIEDSKRSQDDWNTIYDEAEELLDAVRLRMVSRYARRDGTLPGFVACVSSARYEDDFTDKKIKEAKMKGPASSIFYTRRATYEAKPKYMFPSGEFFYINTDTMEQIPKESAKVFLDLIKAIEDSCFLIEDLQSEMNKKLVKIGY